MEEKKVISVPIENYVFTELSDDLAKVRINVYHNSYNPNGSFFEDSCFTNSSESFKNKPICASYVYDDDGNIEDFQEHNDDEKPIGVLPETNNYTVQDIDNLKWASVDGIIFKEYCPEAYELLKEGKKISMEIEVLDGFRGKDKFYHIKQFNLLCITALGDAYDPAMGENATIELFSKSDSESFATKFSLIINRANEILNNISTEGGKSMKREEIISKFSTLEKLEKYKEIIENSSLTDEELEKQLFALSQNQLNKFICDALCEQQCIKQDWSGCSYECDKYCLIDTIPSDNIAIVIDCECYEYYGIPYTVTGDIVTLDYENMQQYVVGDWRPYDDGGMVQDDNMMQDFIDKTFGCKKKMDDNEGDMPEGCQGDCKNCDEEMKKQCNSCKKQMSLDVESEKEKYSLLEKELDSVKGEFVTLKSEYTDMQEQIKVLNDENTKLKQYKADKELKFKEATYEELLEEYSELKNVEGYNDLIKDKLDYSLDELEVKLKVFAFDNNITINKKQKFIKQPEKPVNLVTEQKAHSENLGAWGCLVDVLPTK